VPELPEVETVVRALRPELVGRTFERTAVRWTRSLGGVSPRALDRALSGARVGHVGRRGKFIVIGLERAGAPAGAVLVHLRMTGRLTVDAPPFERAPWLRVACALDDGRRLAFVDVRKFGRFLWTPAPDERLAALGPEPLAATFTADVLYAGLRRRARMLKPLLLDQTFVAGLGNIYVDEVLHRARLSPLAASRATSRAKAEALHAAIQETLREAIRREGSSFDAFYRTPEGRPGSYQHQFVVYGRTGLPCRTCGASIRRIVVAQRGTHVCPRCQRARVRRVRSGRRA
jgi:formamidopyrimidine-DNA glycosylase